MKLTEEQYQLLSRYEEQFRTAVKSKWARFPGTAALHQIHSVYVQVTKRSMRLNTSCSTCSLRLLTEMGNIYFADKAERESKSRVQVSKVQVATEEKVEVKTRRGRKPKEE